MLVERMPAESADFEDASLDCTSLQNEVCTEDKTLQAGLDHEKTIVKSSSSSDCSWSQDDFTPVNLVDGEQVNLELNKVVLKKETPTIVNVPARLVLTNFRLLIQQADCTCTTRSITGHESECRIKGQGNADGSPLEPWPRQLPQRGESSNTKLEIPLFSIRRLETISPREAVITCKNFLKVRLKFGPKELEGFMALCKPLCCCPIQRTFAFTPGLVSDEERRQAWQLFDLVEDYKRMGMLDCPQMRIVDQTASFAFCATYPRYLMVAKSTDDYALKKACQHRRRGRIPVAVWRDASSNAVLGRCSQPLVGIRNVRSKEDESLVSELMTGTVANALEENQFNGDAKETEDAVLDEEMENELVSKVKESKGKDVTKFVADVLSYSISTFSPFDRQKSSEMAQEGSATSDKEVDVHDCKYCIVDARSLLVTYGNRVIGMGTESKEHYAGACVLYMNVENIHVVRTSYEKLVELVQPKFETECFHRALSDTGWLQQVTSILSASIRVVTFIDRYKKSVLTHCSDGWDRTAQMVAMAELLLDPFYRTCRGFAILIEKEWCAFGHMFASRGFRGFQESSSPMKEFAPVFLLWIDCVWQVIRQFPSAFEFNEQFLIALLDGVDSGRYGTFLCNNEMARIESGVYEKTMPIWPSLLNNDKLKNAQFMSVSGALYPSCSSKNVKFWEKYYSRYDPTSV